MARRPGERVRAADLSPRARTIAGWLAALLLVVGIAFVVGLVGGDGGAPAVNPSPSGPTSPEGPLPIIFGTALDVDGSVPDAATMTRFVAGDTFAYAVEGGGTTLPPEVYVEVVRIGGGPQEPVQTPSVQLVPPERTLIGFQVPAQALLDAFGPGEYVMRIYLEPAGEAIAEGRFTLVAEPAAS